jgi:hypothetical protein
MAYVVERESGRIIDRCDAWDLQGVDKMIEFARSGGKEVSCEITMSGDMVIWVG